MILQYDPEHKKYLPETGLQIPIPPPKPQFKRYVAVLLGIIMSALLLAVPFLVISQVEGFEARFWVILVTELTVALSFISGLSCVYNSWKKKRDLWESDVCQQIMEWNQRNGCLEK